MTPTLTRPHPARSGNLAGSVLVGATVAILLVIAAVMAPAMQLPSFVGRITIANPSVYALQVDVTGTSRDGWLVLGDFSRESVRSAYEVIDQGRQWIFRFRSAGEEAGQLVISRLELQNNHWRLTVPDEVAEELRVKGVPPSVE